VPHASHQAHELVIAANLGVSLSASSAGSNWDEDHYTAQFPRSLRNPRLVSFRVVADANCAPVSAALRRRSEG